MKTYKKSTKSKPEKRSRKPKAKLDLVTLLLVLCRTVILLSVLLVAFIALDAPNGDKTFVWVLLGTVASCATLATGHISN
jgi:hypothetical protein